MIEVVLDPAADGLHDVEEDVGLHLRLAGQQQVREEVVVAFVQFVEIQAALLGEGAGRPNRLRAQLGGQYTRG